MADDSAFEDFSKLPLDEQLTHKVWRARVQGYQSLVDIFRRLDPDDLNGYRKYIEYIRKAAADSNQVAQEAGLGAVIAFLEFGPAGLTSKTRKEVVAVMIEKCFASTRTGTRSKAIDIVMLYWEVEAVDGMVDDLLKGTENKNPKISACSVLCLAEGLKSFGPKIVDVKPVLKQLPTLFGHGDKVVRDETFKLTVELHRWLGAAINPSLESLKPVQAKELQDAFSAQPVGRPKPARLLRKEQAAAAAAPAGSTVIDDGPGESAGVEEEAVVDPLEFVEEVAVLDKIPPDFYEKMSASKWQERKEAMDGLMDLLKAPKFAEGRYHELVGVLAKHIGDINLFVATLSANAIEKLARGLRGSFAPYRGTCISPLLEKFKEKKASVVEALANALDAVFGSVTFTEITEDIVATAGHKLPQVKTESLRWLIRCLRTSKKPPGKAEIKALGEMLMKTIDDSASDVRELSAEALGTMLRIVGERPMMAFLDRLKADKIKDAKVREFADRAEVASGEGQKPATAAGVEAAPKGGAPRTAPTRDLPGVSSSSRTIAPKPGAKAGVKKPSAGASPASGSKASSKTAKPAAKAAVVEAPISYKWSEESAEEACLELFDAALISGLGDSNWKTRLESITAIFEKVKEKSVDELDTEMFARLFLRKPSWKENNFQVAAIMVNIFSHLAKAKTFNKGTGALLAPGLVDKLSDGKLKKVASDCLSAIGEGLSFQFALSQIYEPIKLIKAPKAQQEAYMWINSALLDFGIADLNLKDLVECIKLGLGNSAQLVRTTAIAIIGTLATFMGPDIRGSFQDQSAALLSSIETELTRVSGRTAAKPSKTQKLLTKGGSADRPSEAPADDGASALDDLFPRVDLSALMTDELLAELADANWKIRKEALDKLAGLLQGANNRIKPNLGDVVPALKERLSDSNKNLVIQTLDILGNLALATGKPFDKSARAICPSICACLTDNKPQVRAGATAALDKICSATAFDVLVPACETGLATDNPSLRKDLLGWISTKLSELKERAETAPALPGLVMPTLLCLNDKNLEVRKAAQTVVPLLVDLIGYDPVREKALDAKGIAAQTIVSFVDTFRSTRAVAIPPGADSQARGTPKKMLSISSVASKSAVLAAGAKRKVAPTVAPPPDNSTNENLPALLTSDAHAKKDRAEKDKGVMRWQFEAPRKELTDFLAEQTDGNFSDPVRNLMFRDDHTKDRDFLKAVAVLEECIVNRANSLEDYGVEPAEMAARIVANTDLILKYVTIRLCDTNTVMTLKVINLLEQLFSFLGDQDGFRLSEYEATTFLPFIVVKIGDSKESVRNQIRQLFARICRVYPVSKLFPHILDGIKSKNSRVRAECLEELTSLIKRHGLIVCSPPRVMPMIALQIADRDAAVRNGALNFLAQTVQLENGNKEKVFQYIGRMSDKDKSLLEERVKRMPAGPASLIGRSDVQAVPGGSRPATPVKAAPTPAVVETRPPAVTSVKVNRVFSLDFDDSVDLPPESPMEVDPQPWESASGALSMLQLALAKVERQDFEAFKDLNVLYKNNVIAIIVSLMDIVASISVTLARTTDKQFSGECISILILFFSNYDIVRNVTTDSLTALLPEILRRIQNASLYTEEERPAAAKSLNSLMGKILENVDKTRCFCSLLTLLRNHCSALHQNGNVIKEAEKQQVSGVLDLVLKCLWKLTKQVPQLAKAGSLDIPVLLHEIHVTLQHIPPSEYKKSAEKNVTQDLPGRTVKTLLNNLSDVIGSDIFKSVDPKDVEESTVVTRFLQNAQRKRPPAEGFQPAESKAREPYPAESANVLSASSTDEKLARELVGLKISINASELPVDASIAGMPQTLQRQIRSQVSAATLQAGRDGEHVMSESERRQEKLLEFKRSLMTGSSFSGTADVRESKPTYADFSPDSNGSTDVSPSSQEINSVSPPSDILSSSSAPTSAPSSRATSISDIRDRLAQIRLGKLASTN